MNSSILFRYFSALLLSISMVGCKSDVSPEEADHLGAEMIQALIDNNPTKARTLLKKGANPNSKHERGSSVLMASCLHGGYTDIVKMLLKKGADPKYIARREDPFYDGMTALYIAAEQGNLEIVKLLLQKGSDIDAGNGKVGTPIVTATLNGHNQVIKELIEAGADVNGWSSQGVTALICAASNANVELSKILLEAGANVNAQNLKGPTALATAASYGNLRLLKLLLEAGADPTIESQSDNIICRPLVKAKARLYLRKEAERAGALSISPELQAASQDSISIEELEEMVQVLEAAEK